jgi:glycosyltransferase involved in cell wall biosynthesis
MRMSESGMSGLHVFMTADAIGGVWQYALDLAEGLRLYGINTTLAVLGPEPSADQAEAAKTADVALVSTGLPLDWTADNPQDIEEAGRAISDLAAELQANIIHLNNPALAATATFTVPVIAVCHSCVATWWQAVRGDSLPDEFVWRTELVRKGYRSADRLLAPTAAFARATARSDAPSDPFVFTAGRLWDEGKNLLALDRAAAVISKPVLAAGSLCGPNGATIETHHVKTLGHLTDGQMASYLRMRPVFVSAARYEPFGLAVLEAAQAECALVLADIPTFRELWNDAAVFVQPDDDQMIAEAVERLVKDHGERQRLGAKARKNAEMYSLERMSAGVCAAYRSLLDGRDRPALKGAAA